MGIVKLLGQFKQKGGSGPLTIRYSSTRLEVLLGHLGDGSLLDIIELVVLGHERVC